MRLQQIRDVAMREIRIRGRSKGYRAITVVLLLLAIAAPIALQFVPDPSEDLREVSLGLTAETPALFEPILEAVAEDALDLTLVDLRSQSSVEIRQQLSNGDIDVAFEPPSKLIWSDTADSAVFQLVSAALQQVAALDRAEELGIEEEDLATVFAPLEVTEEFVEGSENTEAIRTGVAFFGLMLAFLIPQIFGQFTMMSVVEEKQTRVVEVLLSQIRPATLLAGKILGLSALAIVQIVVLLAGLIGSLLATDSFAVPASVWRFVPMIALSLLCGLAIYNTLFALLGSLISRQEDQAQVMVPVFVPMMVGYFVGQTAAFNNAESLIAKILTWFPLTTPMLLPVRIAKDAIGPIETAVSIGLMLLTVVVLYRLAARIYEFTLLRTGSRVGWAEVIRLSLGSAVR